jgi:hypothetical protein
MKKLVYLLCFISLNITCLKAQINIYTSEIESTTIETSNGTKTNLADVFDSLQGNNYVIMIWNSNDSNCIQKIDKVKELQKKNPSIKFLYISTDENRNEWLKAIKKYELKDLQIILTKPINNSLIQELNINLLPRFIVINKLNNMVLNQDFEVNFEEISNTIKELQ